MKSKTEIANAVIQAEAAYIQTVRDAITVSPERALLERETHDALNTFLTKMQG